MPERLESADELKIHVKNRDFPALSKLLNGMLFEEQPSGFDAQGLARPDVLFEELEIQIEDLKNEAVRRFDKEEFAYCLETFEFLSQVNPDDRSVKDYLELCRECVQQQAVSEPHRDADSFTQNGISVRVESSQHDGDEQSQPTELTRKMRAYFDNRDFEALKRVVKEALRDDARESAPGGTRHKIDGSRRREEEELKEEFETHIQNLREEAIRQFQSAAYGECLGTFRFLCELDPDDPDLRRYLEGCLEFTEKQPFVSEGRVANYSHQPFSGDPENPALALKSVPSENRAASSSNSSDSGSERGLADSELHIVEIPGDCLPGASSAKTAETGDASHPNWRFPSAWLKLALPTLAAVCLLIWLVAPRQGPGLHETPDAENESLGSVPVLIEKAESAMAGRRYLTPVDDNVVFYCGRILADDALNAKALELKKESVRLAVKQANELTSSGRYEDARELYQALLDLPTTESVSQQDLRASLRKVEFDSYPVVHDHFIGSCKGTLKINGYALSFVPSGGSKDGFVERLSRIELHAPEDTLRIEVNHKTYRFEGSSSKNQRDRREAASQLHRMLRNRIEERQ